MEQISRTLWIDRSTHRYYRLHARGITPNGCWLIAPRWVELLDIDIATGMDVCGEAVEQETGVVPAEWFFIIDYLPMQKNGQFQKSVKKGY